MKKICLFLLMICLIGIACEKEEQQLECKLCDNYDTLKILTDEKMQIIKAEFSDGIDSFLIAYETAYDGLMPSIVPCNILPEKYRKEGLKVKVSGIVTGYLVQMYPNEPFIRHTPSNVFILTNIE